MLLYTTFPIMLNIFLAWLVPQSLLLWKRRWLHVCRCNTNTISFLQFACKSIDLSSKLHVSHVLCPVLLNAISRD